MRVEKFTNKILSSNSYIIHSNSEKNVWVVDPGESEQLLRWINGNEKTVKGILLTHAHIDHIYGVNDICNKFPDLIIYASEFANEGMQSAKANGSYYMEMSYIIDHSNINIVKQNSTIELFMDKTIAKVISSPGHNNDCISFHIENNLFTGDALIPGVKIHTKSKQSNKTIAKNTVKRIFESFDDNTIIWPGHKDESLLGFIKLDTVLK